MAEKVWKCRTHEVWEEGPVSRDSVCGVWIKKAYLRDGEEDEPEPCDWVKGWFVTEADYEEAERALDNMLDLPEFAPSARPIVNAALGIEEERE